MRIALAVALLLLTGCSEEKPAPTPDPTPTITGVQSYPVPDKHHFKPGKGEYPHAYPQSPPVGGPHVDRWLACDVYTTELPKENAVHSLEHGAMWLTYQPGYAKEGLLVAMAALNPEYVLVSPYEGQDSPVVATAWGLQLKVQDAGDPRVVAFVRSSTPVVARAARRELRCATGGAGRPSRHCSTTPASSSARPGCAAASVRVLLSSTAGSVVADPVVQQLGQPVRLGHVREVAGLREHLEAARWARAAASVRPCATGMIGSFSPHTISSGRSLAR